MPSANASGEFDAVRNPLTPSCTISGIPPAAAASTGFPAENASRITRVVASNPDDGTTSKSNSATASPIWSLHPANSMGSPAASRRTCASYAGSENIRAP